MVSEEQKARFAQQGVVVFKDLFALGTMDQLKQAALHIVDEFDAESTRSIFTTKGKATSSDQYFLSSDDAIRCFFEEDAFDQHGNLAQAKSLSINKIGHALHKHNTEFNVFTKQGVIGEIARALGLVTPLVHQSMYIFKQPKIGGEVSWHQDATYFLTHPSTVLTFWLAIEDANLNNGCLMIAPNTGNYPLKEQFKRFKDDTTELKALHPIAWPNNSSAEPLEVSAGSLVVFNGVLPHFSRANTSDKSRHAFTLHITCGTAKYDEYNWLRAEPLAI
jgi:ectoine hydroxylase-related dioxygenase (phytanoyl-CoA dioxygenase family)